jgi:DNA-binding NtrC family response regulator
VHFDWNITHTAEALAVSPTTLRKKIADYDLRRPGDAH